MAADLAQHYTTRLAQADARLATVTEETANWHVREAGWTRKQVLGHLLDSAANNHQRFVRAQLDGRYDGPGYGADAWVAIHGYDTWTWAELMNSWRDRNAVLTKLVARMDESTLGALCVIGGDAPVPLRFVVEDYLDHLEHHVKQILDGSTGPRAGH